METTEGPGMKWVAWGFGVLVCGLLLWVLGRLSMTREVNRHIAARQVMLDYHNDLTDFANGDMNDARVVDDLISRTSRVTEALGRGNVVYGLIVGHMMLNGVTLLPRAIYSIRDSLMSNWRHDDAFKTIQVVRGVLIKSIGSREHVAEKIGENAQNPIAVIGRGWSIVIAVPLHVLSGIGLINPGQAARAVNSLLFKLVSLATFVAAIAGPVLAYLADRKNIETEVSRLATGTEAKPVSAPNK